MKYNGNTKHLDRHHVACRGVDKPPFQSISVFVKKSLQCVPWEKQAYTELFWCPHDGSRKLFWTKCSGALCQTSAWCSISVDLGITSTELMSITKVCASWTGPLHGARGSTSTLLLEMLVQCRMERNVSNYVLWNLRPIRLLHACQIVALQSFLMDSPYLSVNHPIKSPACIGDIANLVAIKMGKRLVEVVMV